MLVLFRSFDHPVRNGPAESISSTEYRRCCSVVEGLEMRCAITRQLEVCSIIPSGGDEKGKAAVAGECEQLRTDAR